MIGNYSENIYDVLYVFINNPSDVNKDYQKLVGKFLFAFFENTSLLKKPFKDVYKLNVKVVSNKPSSK